MKKRFLLSFLLPLACLDEEKEMNDTGELEENTAIEDCSDEIDNDEDGDIDCDDSDCIEDSSCAEDDTAEETGEPNQEPPISVVWGEASISLSFDLVALQSEQSERAEYFWGIAETSDCEDCWTGEDCFNGYEINQDSTLSYCHPVSESGGELRYGGDAPNLTEGTDTVFNNQVKDFSATTTHILIERGSEGDICWVWGDDTSYYSEYERGCTDM